MSYEIYVTQKRFFTVSVEEDEVTAWVENGNAPYADEDIEANVIYFVRDLYEGDEDSIQDEPFRMGRAHMSGPTEIEVDEDVRVTV